MFYSCSFAGTTCSAVHPVFGNIRGAAAYVDKSGMRRAAAQPEVAVTSHKELRIAGPIFCESGLRKGLRVQPRQPSPGSNVGVRLLPQASQVCPVFVASSHSEAANTLILDTPSFWAPRGAPRGMERGRVQSQCTQLLGPEGPGTRECRVSVYSGER